MTVVLNINVKVVVVVEVEAIFYHQWLRCLVVFCLRDVGCALVVVKERICATDFPFFLEDNWPVI